MEYGRLGTTGATISRICLGMMTYGKKSWRPWILEEEEARPLIRAAVEAGITFFDTADVYSLGASEEITGRLLKEFGPSRDQLVIATKVFYPLSQEKNDGGLSRKHIMQSVDASLRRLGVDYIDLYQIHRFDPETPMEETLSALDSLVRAGKVLYLGASSMYSWQFLKMLEFQKQNGLARFVTMQNHYNLMYREEEREMTPLCEAEGIGCVPWSPLARGMLAGTRKRGETKEGSLRAQTDEPAHDMYNDADYAVVDRVVEIAAARGVTPAQIALGWLLSKKAVSAPIVGVTKPHHLEDAVAATSLRLTADEIKRMEELYIPHPVLGNLS
jgi:aryl-alcohol dehydrogenase-like predicted oxidoreductase